MLLPDNVFLLLSGSIFCCMKYIIEMIIAIAT